MTNSEVKGSFTRRINNVFLYSDIRMLKENQETRKTRLHDGGNVLISDQDTTFPSKEKAANW